MARRKTSLFNLSFLDVLTSALGAIIFLFIITPKGGGETAAKVRQALVYFDTAQMKIHGDLHDSLLSKRAGDTLFTVLLDYKMLPGTEEPRRRIFAFNERREEPKPERPVEEKEIEMSEKSEKTEKPEEKQPTPDPVPAALAEKPKPPVYRGDAPSVPCLVSFEISWPSRDDNVDLFICKGDGCVYGGRKRDRDIGEWDSGKSRNRLFGNDLRTNQEAVRQFDRIIPGDYKIYAEFKDSKKNKESLVIKGLLYTQDKDGNERGEAFTKLLKLGAERSLIGTVTLRPDGTYEFRQGA